MIDDEELSALREHTFFGDVLQYFNNAAAYTKYPVGLLDQIKFCNSVYRFKFPIRIKNEIEVISIPGATALIAALTISGLPTDSFVFEGFLPQKKGRQKKLGKLSGEERTIVLYESSHRIVKLIEELVQYFPERYVVVCRELTKKFEESWRGYPIDLKEKLNEKIIKGEFVVVIASKNWKV